MPREEFWDSTFGEIEVFLEGAADAHRDALNAATSGAWETEHFARMNRLPELSSVLLKAEAFEPPPRDLAREMAVWDRFYGRLGVTSH
jgi:hypothetical protein